MSAKVGSAATVDPAVAVASSPAGEGDGFANLMANLGISVEASADGLPAAGLAALPGAALAALLAPGEGEAASNEAAGDEAQQACCMIEIANLAARMLVRTKDGRPEEGEGEKAPQGEDEGEKPTDDQPATSNPTTLGQPLIALPVAIPPQEVVEQVAPKQTAAPVAQVAVTLTPQPPVKSEQPMSAEPASLTLPAEKPAALPQPLRFALQQALRIGNAPETVRTESASSLDALAASADRPAALPMPGAALAGTAFQALMQPAAALLDQTPAAEQAATPIQELAVEHQLDMASNDEWLDNLARDIARTAGNEGSLRFRLNPETLGTLRVEVAQSHAGTTVRLTADTEAARQIIADAQPRLVAEARAQGVRIAEAHVGMEHGSYSDQRRQGEARQETLLRTAGSTETQNEETTRTATQAAERFA